MAEEIDYGMVGRAPIHETQRAILEALASEDTGYATSPTRFAQEHKLKLGPVAYHFGSLAKRGWITLARTVQRRGAVEHYYSLSDSARVGSA